MYYNYIIRKGDNKMKEKVKKFCYHELEILKKWGGDHQQALTRCYGAVMFVLSIEPDEDESTESLGWWWDNEFRPNFYEMGVY